MPRIFISYRREDAAGYAISLRERIANRFGERDIFMDVDSIEPGEEYADVIRDRVGACDVFLALIGREWLTCTDESGRRRLDDPEDFVRLEIVTALERKIRVIPLLVGGARPLKPSEVPAPLVPLCRRHATELSDTRFRQDVDRLIATLERLGAAEGVVTGEGAVVGSSGTPTRRSLSMRLRGFVRVLRSHPIVVVTCLAVLAVSIATLVTMSPVGLFGASESAEEQYQRGLDFEHGRRDVPQDYTEASRWYRRAAERGNVMAQTNLGVLYEKGLGLEKDERMAVKWYRKAADGGERQGQANLGLMYAFGRGGLAENKAEAVKWYRKAANEGNGPAQLNLGFMYERGDGGLQKDEAEAVSLYRKAADQGLADAQHNLGVMYAEGRGGLAKDDGEAVKWFREAAGQGHQGSRAALRQRGLSH